VAAAVDEGLDSDAAGLSDIEEVRHNSDPQDPEDRPRSVGRDDGGISSPESRPAGSP